MTIIEAIEDAKLFKPWFRDEASWAAWMVFLKALFGLPLARGEMATYRRLTGRQKAPTQQASEAWLVVGRRGGKSFIIALVAVFLACFKDWTPYLAPGERGTVMVLAADRKQARVIMRYVTALLHDVPFLKALIERETAEAIDLANRITVEIHTANFRAVRGYTIVAALCDEVAWWRSEDTANPDKEILDALRPAMATVPGALLLCASSPYRRAGALYEAHRDHYGQDGDPVLVIQADTRTMNPTVSQDIIDAAYERDPVSAAAEYGAEFRSDISGFLDPDWIARAVMVGGSELAPDPGKTYKAFVDPSGGRRDAFTLGIAHKDGGRTVLDVCRGQRPPFNPDSVVVLFATIMGRYGVHQVTGDRYGAEWVAQAFRNAGIEYLPAGKPKSEIYLEVEPQFATGMVMLLDHRVLTGELRNLERRTTRAGRDSVDHPPRAHDDHANAACGALWLVGQEDDAPQVRAV